MYDWMYNDEWGEYGADPTLGQWRAQIEYAFNGCNAVGLWACKRDLSAQQAFVIDDRNVMVTNRAISQANLFWHHKFCSGADSYLWLGIPDHGRLDGDGSLIDWTVGASVQVPLTCRLALYANGAYYHPSAVGRPRRRGGERLRRRHGRRLVHRRQLPQPRHLWTLQRSVHAGCQQQQLPGRAEPSVLGLFWKHEITAATLLSC